MQCNKYKKLCRGLLYLSVLLWLGVFTYYRIVRQSEKDIAGPQEVIEYDLESLFESEEDEEVEEPLWATFDPNEVGFKRDIFFIESSGSLGLTARQGCVVEAAATNHPFRNIWVLFTGGNVSTINVFDSGVTVSLLFYRNIKLRHLPVSKTFKYTKLWRWFVFSDWQKSEDHDSLLWLSLSLLLLYKHGGLVLGWDSFTLHPLPFPVLGQCFPDELALHVLGLPAKHIFVENILDKADISAKLEDISKDTARRELDRLCKVNNLNALKYKKCKSFPLVLGESSLCPIEKKKHWIMFDEKRKKIAQNQIADPGTKVVNLWLDDSGGLKEWASPTFKTFLYDLAEQHCPVVFETNENKL